MWNKTSQMIQLEKAEGKPIEEILMSLYEQYGSQTEVAKQIGVSQGTISSWLLRLGLRQRVVLEPVEYAT